MKLYWLMLLFPLLTPADRNTLSQSPSGLMVEFIREPAHVIIMDSRPEFTWIVPDAAGMQTAYQILVSSSEERLKKDEADCWNSNKTFSSRSAEIEYAGAGLDENRVYFWKVRIWDKKERTSAFSKIQAFKTGKFEVYKTTGNRFNSLLIKPVKLLKTGAGHYFADFGKDAFGTLVLDLKPEKNDTIIVHLGEKTDGVNKIDRNPGGTIRYIKVPLAVTPGRTSYTLILPPDARNTGPNAVHLPDSFGVIMPFRYCEIENCSVELTPDNIYQKAFWYNFDDTQSVFESSDTILNQIWAICKYSIKATSFAGIYVDGDRERIPYEADAYINQLGHYYTDREYSIARLTNEYFISHPTWPTEWILQTILLFYNDYMYTGNIESLNRYYDKLQHKTLISLAREDGLISSKNATDETMALLGFSNAKDRIRDIVDWPPSQKDTGWKLAAPAGERDGYDMVEINTVVNAFHYRSLVLMAKLAGYLGRSADAVIFQKQAARVKKAINEKLFDPKRGIYIDGEFSNHSSLHANMMPLAFDLVPEEHIKTVTDFIKTRGMACSVYGAQFLLEGLYKAGESDYAYDLLTATDDRSWWNMIRSGTTITLEAWDLKYKPNLDWNHAWGAAPANIIPGHIWGISPAEPGYAKAVIKPQLVNLSFCKTEVPTIRGNIKAEFKFSNNSKEYSINIPANIECEFLIYDEKGKSVFLNGKKIVPMQEKISLLPGSNKIIIK